MRSALLLVVLSLFAAPAAAGENGYAAELLVDEPGFDASLRLSVWYLPGFLQVPPSVGRLVLVRADSAAGRDAFFVPSDLAFEAGDRQLYRVEFEQSADLLGQALGGRLRPGDVQTGLVLLPDLLRLDEFLPAHPESVVVRYAHHRAPLRAASAAEREAWEAAAPRPLVAAGLNAWWEWAQAVAAAPDMEEGERRLFAERLFPGQGHVIHQEGIPAEALRNAILRVGERRLLDGPARQRVAPRYPAAARQAGASGLVVTLVYLTPAGEVADASILASNAVHLLNLSALSAVMEWRFAPVQDETGSPTDGWRVIPFQFRLPGDGAPEIAGESPALAADRPPRVAKLADAGYPEEARKKRLKGTVVYRVSVDERGKMVAARLEKGVHPILDEAALLALEQSLFVPGTRDGVPVGGELSVPIAFEGR